MFRALFSQPPATFAKTLGVTLKDARRLEAHLLHLSLNIRAQRLEAQLPYVAMAIATASFAAEGQLANKLLAKGGSP